MKKKAKTVIVIMLILTFVVINLYTAIRLSSQFSAFKQQSIPISIDVTRNHLHTKIDTLDIDHDGEDEVSGTSSFPSPNKQSITVVEPITRDYRLEHYGDILTPQDYVFFDTYYNNRLKNYALRFLQVEDNVLFLRELDNRQNLIESLPFEKPDRLFNEKGNWFKNPRLVDLETDGKKELVIILQSGYDRDPRGIVCFDFRSRRLLWSYYSGTKIEDAKFYDLDGDGKKEIILTSFAANNGIEENGSSDHYSYVIVLDSRGKKMWHKRTGEWHTHARVAVTDLDGDGKCEIIAAAEYESSRRRVQSKVFLFNGIDGNQEEDFFHPEVSFSEPVILKIKNKDNRIYVGGSDGTLRMLDKNLKELKKIRREAPLFVLKTSATAESWHFIYARCRNKLLVFDRNLDREIFSREFNFEGEFEMIPLRVKEGRYALINADKLYRLSEEKVSFTDKVKKLAGTGFVFTLFVLVLFNGFFLYSLFCIYSSILPFLKRKKSFLHGDVMDHTELHEIVQTVTHQVKNPISTILWTAEKIKRDSGKMKEAGTKETYSQLADVLMDDVKTMREHTHHISKLVRVQNPVFRETNLKPILEEVVEHYRNLLNANKKTGIQLKADDISMPMDKALFKDALALIIDNVLNIVPQGGNLTISTIPMTSPITGTFRGVLIEIEDTGIGMAEKELSQVFKPFFTKKEEITCIDLTICRRIIEAHYGEIEIRSRKGFGSRIAIRIPVRRGTKN